MRAEGLKGICITRVDGINRNHGNIVLYTQSQAASSQIMTLSKLIRVRSNRPHAPSTEHAGPHWNRSYSPETYSLLLVTAQ